MQSILSNFPSQRLGNQPKKILHLDFSKVTLGQSTKVTTKNYNKSITLSNLNSSVMNSFFGSSYILESQSIIDTDIPTTDAATEAAAFDAIISNTIETVSGPYGSNVSVLKQNIISKKLTPGTNPASSPSQTWVRILRAAPGGVAPSNIDSLFISQWRRNQIGTPKTLPEFLDYSDPSGVAFWLAEIELKSGGYAGTVPAGDYRLSIRREENASGLYWSVRGDDRGNNSAVPGVPVDPFNRQLWRVDSTLGMPAEGELYRIDAWILRHQATTNRTLVTVTLASTMQTYVICDKISSASLKGVADAQEGLLSLPWTRLLLAGLYADSLGTDSGAGTNYPCNGYVHDLQVWDKPPYQHGKLEVGNFGPLPWVPTPLSKATYYVSPTGSSGNDGSIGSPKTFQSALNAALPDDVIFMRGGTYPVTSAANLNIWAEGTEASPIIIECYPGEAVVIDGSTINPGVDTTRNSNISGWYQVIRGIAFKNMPEYGTFLTGHHNRLQHCEIAYNKLSGAITYQSGSPPWDPLKSSYNLLESCWIHHNSDVGLFSGNYDDGGNADGVSFSTGIGNQARHCLIEYNSDDGADSWRSKDSQFKYCIIRYNGLGNGNGNGVKAGGNTEGEGCIVNHNLVYGNLNNGIDANTGIDVDISSNTTWDNGGVGYVFEATTSHERNVSIGDGATHTGTGVPGLPNSWDIAGTPTFISTTEGNADFLKVTQDGTFDNIGAHYL